MYKFKKVFRAIIIGILSMFFIIVISFNASAEEISPDIWQDPNTPYDIDDDFCRPINALHEQKKCTDTSYQIYFTADADMRSEKEEFSEFYFSTSGGQIRNIYACSSGYILSVNNINNMLELQYYDDSGYEYRFQYLLSFYGNAEDGSSSLYTVGEGDYVEKGQVIGQVTFGNNIQEMNLWFGILDVNAMYYYSWSEFFEIDDDDSDIYGNEFNVTEWYNEFFTDETKALWDSILSVLENLLAPPIDKYYREMLQAVIDSIYEYASETWNSIANQITDSSLLNNSNAIYRENAILRILSQTAKSLVIMCFIFELTRRVSHENDFITNKKEGIIFILFLSLTFSLVARAPDICRGVIDFNSRLVKAILSGSYKYNIVPIEIIQNDSDSTLYWIFRELLSAIKYNMDSFLGILIFTAIMILAFIVIIKVLVRQLELVAMIVVSPLFFACIIYEDSRQYFKNFVRTFLSTVVETLYMAIIYSVGAIFYNGQFAGVTSIESTDTMTIMKLLTLVAIAALMIKPSEALKECIPNF